MSRFVRLTVILVLSFCLTITACRPQLWNKGVNQSQLNLVYPSDAATFNFAMNTSPFSVFPFIYQGLVKENPVTTELEPDLAKSWTVSDDRLKITFTLRDKLKWSDGKPLNVDDVIFTYKDIYLNPKIPTVFKDFLRIGNQDVIPSIQKLD
ncbi:MAG: ABC transporter substrate-binding protein, partial [Rivularia sp. ALOHA_DT_140]|nr:ABC transporter substrate-binding protein [Rivularia sp. ALOHA_DT_140]